MCHEGAIGAEFLYPAAVCTHTWTDGQSSVPIRSSPSHAERAFSAWSVEGPMGDFGCEVHSLRFTMQTPPHYYDSLDDSCVGRASQQSDMMGTRSSADSLFALTPAEQNALVNGGTTSVIPASKTGCSDSVERDFHATNSSEDSLGGIWPSLSNVEEDGNDQGPRLSAGPVDEQAVLRDTSLGEELDRLAYDDAEELPGCTARKTEAEIPPAPVNSDSGIKELEAEEKKPDSPQSPASSTDEGKVTRADSSDQEWTPAALTVRRVVRVSRRKKKSSSVDTAVDQSTQASKSRLRPKATRQIARIEPSEREVARAMTGREHDSLKIWCVQRVNHHRVFLTFFYRYTRLNELAGYKAIHGNCNVPQKYEDNPQLGIWVNKQRMEKKVSLALEFPIRNLTLDGQFLDIGKSSAMTACRIQQLENLGFTWAKRKGDFAWNNRFSQLEEYVEIYGNANVPTKYPANKALGRWVSTQRSQYKLWKNNKKCQMTQEHYDLLTGVGFCFDMMHTEPSTRPREQEESPHSRRPKRTRVKR